MPNSLFKRCSINRKIENNTAPSTMAGNCYCYHFQGGVAVSFSRLSGMYFEEILCIVRG